MLCLKEICKHYRTGELVQKALDGVSLNFRDSEFVSVLGPNGSGKTTLLNIIGGLDRYDSGDLLINGISTKDYKDRDWDSYRNHTIGFVFQSYNLILHQSILANVELAERYSTRIVKLRDGKIIDDSDPFCPEMEVLESKSQNMGKAKMSFFTSLSLSFHNLCTKKGRTILTAFAGSIGIIGIALILSLSNGVNQYIEDIQRDTMTSYPITVSSQAVDMSEVIGSRGSIRGERK